ncbi:hypothetical protein [Novosphingobium beihaiensis]|uniref:Uncharacterized protein n=1 Tax=Novosphingobium beihaiensis TaxID=2930389 RepID=A0ABT0BVQ4_9SPHN|nr:hypothetical protein [Novosphingobium beihaiensis]MCJ2189162.1 hypothetical protein [Novosphingobium beihaiensis]
MLPLRYGQILQAHPPYSQAIESAFFGYYFLEGHLIQKNAGEFGKEFAGHEVAKFDH